MGLFSLLRNKKQNRAPDTLAQARAEALREAERYDALPRRGHARMDEYLRRMNELQPEVRAMLAYDLPAHWGTKLITNYNYLSRRMRWVFARCGYSGETLDLARLRMADSTIYPDNYEEYVEKYRGEAGALWAQYEAEREAVREILSACKAEDDAETEFWEHCKTLSGQVKAYLTYELASRHPPQGHSGFHMMASGGVFWACGWARTEPVNGVSFGIDRACFAGRNPLLFYSYGVIERGVRLDSDKLNSQPSDHWMTAVYNTIEGYSSGIRLERMQGPLILFRLDEKNIRKLDILYGGQCAENQPDYMFTWPGAGEFSCTLGEVVDGALIPLHYDDFCMK